MFFAIETGKMHSPTHSLLSFSRPAARLAAFLICSTNRSLSWYSSAVRQLIIMSSSFSKRSNHSWPVMTFSPFIVCCMSARSFSSFVITHPLLKLRGNVDKSSNHLQYFLYCQKACRILHKLSCSYLHPIKLRG